MESTSQPPATQSSSDIHAWLIAYLSELLELDPDEIESDDPLAAYGLDSSGAVCMIGDVGKWLGRDLDPALLYSYPTVAALTRHLSEGAER